MEKEIKELRKDKESMEKEIYELKIGKNKKETNNKEYNKMRAKTVATEKNRKLREELFPPLPVPGSSSFARTPVRTEGPAEEYEEREEDDVVRMGRWDYVGSSDTRRHREEDRFGREEVNTSRRSERETRKQRLERHRPKLRSEGQNMLADRRGSTRNMDPERENRSSLPRRRK